jgi:phage terminase large subunit-like protein
MMPLSRETENKDGLNPSGAIIDEYHAHRTSEIFDLIWSAWGQRSQAILLIITTAGVDAEKSPCFKEDQLCKQILDGVIVNDQYFVMIRELDPEDDEHDQKNWIKANPLRAATPEGLARIKAQHDEVFDSKDPSKIRTFRIKIMNKFVYDSDAGYMGEYLAKWDNLGISREEFVKLTAGMECAVGLDLSKKIDLTADGFVFYLPDGRIAVTAHGFIPDEGLRKHEQTDRVPYRDWARDGWLTVTEGDVTDYSAIESHIHDMELENRWKIHEVCYDPYNATHLANEMAKDGYTCIEIRQGVRTLSEPTKLFREMVAQGLIIHDGSPLLKWALANAKETQDNNQNIKLDKKSPMDTQRIDPLAAIINAMVRLPELKSLVGVDISDQILSEDWGM